MFRVLAFGAAFGAAVQAWRAWPPDGPVTAVPAVVLFVLAVCCAYLAGLWRSRGRATATATATAVASSVSDAHASNTVNVAVLVPRSAGADAQALDSAPWFAGQRPAITADDLDGISLEDVMGNSETSTEYA